MPQPGIGFELECRSIRLANDTEKAKQAPGGERERVRGKELLVGDHLTKAGKYRDAWTLTAELVSTSGIGLLCPEIVVHGLDAQSRRGRGQGVKLTLDNAGVAGEIGTELVDFVTKWSGVLEPVRIDQCDDYGPWTTEKFEPAGKTWGQQITAPIPLASLYAMLPIADPHDPNAPAKTHPFVAARSLIRLTRDDLPAPILKAKCSETEIDALLALLSLIVSYAKQGPRDTVAKGLKHLIPIMPRTDFAAMVRSCEPAIAAFGSVRDLVTYVCDVRNIELKTARLYWQSGAAVIALQVTDWLDQLPKKDLVAEHDRAFRHAQIGGLGATMEHLIGRPDLQAPIFEFRDVGGCATSQLPAFMERVEYEVRRIHELAAKAS